MPRLSSVQKSDATLKLMVQFPGEEADAEPVELTVYPNRVTLGAMRRSQEAMATNDLQKTAAVFFEFMKEWNLKDEKDTPLPFTSATADLLTIDTFNALTKAVTDAILPNRTTSTS